MTREPKIPMSPTELPQQRIHEVVSLPDRPSEFSSYINYGDMPENTVSKNPPRNAIFLCQVEWAWSPAHNRLDSYYLNKGRTHWSLWSRYLNDNDYPWKWVWVPSRLCLISQFGRPNSSNTPPHRFLAFRRQ
jgi:hypothetical protein